MLKIIAAGDTGGPQSYTVPAGKYIIVNALPAPPITTTPATGVISAVMSIVILNGTTRLPLRFGSYARVGPFCFNAGDALTTDVPYSPPNTVPPVINGFLYNTSTVKAPFTAKVIQNSSIYTIPAGKIAVFNVYSASPPYLLLINGVPSAGIPPFSGDLVPSLGARVGPITAKGGDVITHSNQGYLTMPGGGPGELVINGFLDNS